MLKGIARKVEEFIYEFDTYEYRDNYDSREFVVEEIKNQLEDPNTLRQTLEILCNEELTEEEMFNRLGEILKI